MKRTIQETTNKEIDVEIPCYIRFGAFHFTKIVSDELHIVVNTYDFNTGIAYVRATQNNPFGNSGWRFITEEEFNAAFAMAYKKISELAPVTQ